VRAAVNTRLLDVDPGASASVVVEIVNTGAVIDGVTARVIGLPEQFVTSQPALLPLFPDVSGQLTLTLAVPKTHPAGRHPLSIELISHGAREPSQFLDVDLDVAARPAMRLAAQPRVIHARRGGRFVLELTNEGNVPLDVSLSAVDVDRSAKCVFSPTQLRLEAGAVAPVLLDVRGPRMFTGGEVDRAVTVGAAARRVEVRPDPAIEPEVQVALDTTVRLRQRPLISRGLLTALILVSIVALWAGVFLLGLTKVFSGDPMTKQAPASFFVAAADAGSGPHAGGPGAGAAPAGSLPKTGQLPAGVGGEITGKVTGAHDHQPVGRILVEAVRIARHGPQVVSSAASQSDGSYTIAGLFPTSYYVKFSARGFQTVWYPAAPSRTAAKTVDAVAQGSTAGVNATLTGDPASISGSVDPGDTLAPAPTTVVARQLGGSGSAAPVATTKTTAAGGYVLTNLPAPATYELTFTTVGYQASTLVDTVSGGDQRLEPAITLGAGVGQISGVVTDGNVPLGGATVTTTVGGQARVVVTPTTGQVGAFSLGNLPTPATYVITFGAPGHGTDTTIVDLAAGQSRAGLSVSIAGGTGSVTGVVTGPDGKGFGGVTVTVGGAAGSGGAGTAGTAPSTTTLTAGSVGSFRIDGLPVPGAYTLTFTMAGYAPASVPVSLTDNGAPRSVTVRLDAQLGAISGTVSSGSTAYVGASVTATNGQQIRTATSGVASSALPTGGYLITGLTPGTYSVTVTAPGRTQQTGIVAVVAGQTSTLNLGLGG
jgi:hypothetical protein